MYGKPSDNDVSLAVHNCSTKQSIGSNISIHIIEYVCYRFQLAGKEYLEDYENIFK